jgi:hypothetical protein
MRAFHNGSFDPQTLVLIETDELARCVLRMATEGERDPVRLHDETLERLLPSTAWREAS